MNFEGSQGVMIRHDGLRSTTTTAAAAAAALQHFHQPLGESKVATAPAFQACQDVWGWALLVEKPVENCKYRSSPFSFSNFQSLAILHKTIKLLTKKMTGWHLLQPRPFSPQRSSLQEESKARASEGVERSRANITFPQKLAQEWETNVLEQVKCRETKAWEHTQIYTYKVIYIYICRLYIGRYIGAWFA